MPPYYTRDLIEAVTQNGRIVYNVPITQEFEEKEMMMNKLTQSIAGTAFMLLTIGSAFAAPPAKSTPKATALICPVTGEKIASIKDAVGHSTYKGKTYYFCCSACKPMFDKNPAKYLKAAKAPAKAKHGTTMKM